MSEAKLQLILTGGGIQGIYTAWVIILCLTWFLLLYLAQFAEQDVKKND